MSQKDNDDTEVPAKIDKPKAEPIQAQTQIAPPKSTPKFLPPPPSKNGTTVSSGMGSGLAAPPKKENAGIFI